MRARGYIKRIVSLWGNRLARARHARGHGVHSPFVYGLVRQVFMRRTLFAADDRALYEALLAKGVSSRRATQLHNARIYCAAERYAIDSFDGDFIIVTEHCATPLIEAYRTATERGATLVILSPYASRERQQSIRALVEQHASTSVDNRGYIIFTNNHLPKQHFIL